MSVAACRICFDGETADCSLVSPCACRGSSAWIHETCLIEWCQRKGDFTTCDLCHVTYVGSAAVALAHAHMRQVEQLDDGDPKRLRVAHEVASALQNAGRYDEAVALHQGNLRVAERRFGNRHPNYLSILSSCALALKATGNTAEALSMHKKAFTTMCSVQGDEHADSLTMGNNFALALCDNGDLDQAIFILRKIVAGRGRVLGETHKDTLMACNNLAGALSRSGMHDEAMALLHPPLSRLRQSLGDKHVDFITVAQNVVVILNSAGRFAEAADHQRHICAAHKDLLGMTDSKTLESERLLSDLIRAAQECPEVAHAPLKCGNHAPWGTAGGAQVAQCSSKDKGICNAKSLMSGKREGSTVSSTTRKVQRRMVASDAEIDFVLALLLQVEVPYEEAQKSAAQFVTAGFDSLLALRTLDETDMERMGVAERPQRKRLFTLLRELTP